MERLTQKRMGFCGEMLTCPPEVRRKHSGVEGCREDRQVTELAWGPDLFCPVLYSAARGPLGKRLPPAVSGGCVGWGLCSGGRLVHATAVGTRTKGLLCGLSGATRSCLLCPLILPGALGDGVKG